MYYFGRCANNQKEIIGAHSHAGQIRLVKPLPLGYRLRAPSPAPLLDGPEVANARGGS